MTTPSTPVAGTQPGSPRQGLAPGAAAPGRRAVGVIIVLLIGLCLLFIGGYVQRLGEKAAVEAEITRMEQQVAAARVRNAILAKELTQVNDDAHIAAIARDALNLVQEGDQLITIIQAAAPPADAAAAAPPRGAARPPISTDPNWRRWLDLLLPAH